MIGSERVSLISKKKLRYPKSSQVCSKPAPTTHPTATAPKKARYKNRNKKITNTSD